MAKKQIWYGLPVVPQVILPDTEEERRIVMVKQFVPPLVTQTNESIRSSNMLSTKNNIVETVTGEVVHISDDEGLNEECAYLEKAHIYLGPLQTKFSHNPVRNEEPENVQDIAKEQLKRLCAHPQAVYARLGYGLFESEDNNEAVLKFIHVAYCRLTSINDDPLKAVTHFISWYTLETLFKRVSSSAWREAAKFGRRRNQQVSTSKQLSTSSRGGTNNREKKSDKRSRSVFSQSKQQGRSGDVTLISQQPPFMSPLIACVESTQSQYATQMITVEKLVHACQKKIVNYWYEQLSQEERKENAQETKAYLKDWVRVDGELVRKRLGPDAPDDVRDARRIFLELSDATVAGLQLALFHRILIATDVLRLRVTKKVRLDELKQQLLWYYQMGDIEETIQHAVSLGLLPNGAEEGDLLSQLFIGGGNLNITPSKLRNAHFGTEISSQLSGSNGLLPWASILYGPPSEKFSYNTGKQLQRILDKLKHCFAQNNNSPSLPKSDQSVPQPYLEAVHLMVCREGRTPSVLELATIQMY